MSQIIAGIPFEGPYASTSTLKDESGVYVVLRKNDENYDVIDVGESSEVKSRLENHDRREAWISNCSDINSLLYSVYYVPHGEEMSRLAIERVVRGYYNPPCGEI